MKLRGSAVGILLFPYAEEPIDAYRLMPIRKPSLGWNACHS